jgi:G3E family GTPase
MTETLPTPQKTPIIIVTGFLGAGKTTFLRELLPLLKDEPRRPYVILNDFLNAEIDSATLRQVADEVHAISGGCVCCDSSEALNNALHQVPENIPCNVIIEANGTTDPYPLIELVMLLPRHHERFGPVIHLNVINEKRWQKRLLPWDKALERAQAATASHIITNRRLEASLRQQFRVRSELAQINPDAQRIESAQEFALILRSLSTIQQPNLETANPLGHAHHHVATRIELPAMREETLIHWLKSFPPEVLRIKGAVHLIDDAEYESCFFQRTDDDTERPYLSKGKLPKETPPCAVFIGGKLNASAIKASLQPFLASSSKSKAIEVFHNNSCHGRVQNPK